MTIMVLALFVAVSPALAAGPPEWAPSNPEVLDVHSTRVTIEMKLFLEELATKWKAEYAPAECKGGEPGAVPTGKAPEDGWTVVNEVEVPKQPTSTLTLHIGAIDAGEQEPPLAPILLRHLKPETCYYGRFLAENSDSKVNAKGEPEPATALVSFKTLPAETPELPKKGVNEEEGVLFKLENVTEHGVEATAKIETNGAETEYDFEYSPLENGRAPPSGSASWRPFGSGASGKITTSQDYAIVKAGITGLSAETVYYIRIRLQNETGTVFQTKYHSGNEELEFFTTGTEKPRSGSLPIGNVTGVSAHLSGVVKPDGLGTAWRFEFAESESLPSESSSLWKPIPGAEAEGEVTQAQAEATPYFASVQVGAFLRGLTSSTHYFVRLSLENGAGVAVSGSEGFETEGAPTSSTLRVHGLVGESLRLQAAVNPKTVPTSAIQSVVIKGATGGTFVLKFGGGETGPIAYDATAERVEQALNAVLEELAGAPTALVQGVAGGPYTVLFTGSAVGLGELPVEADASGLSPAPSSTVVVSTVQQGGEAYATDYWFQYVSDKDFGVHGWENPGETSHVEAEFSAAPEVVGVDVSGLTSGEGYHYRVVVASTLPGASVIVGGEQELSVPVTPAVAAGVSCPNEASRTGLSARLPDCRAYEQLTPVEKGGAQEPFHYRGGVVSSVLVGEDGDHAALEAPEVNYGSTVVSGQSPYLFSRGGNGWSMVAGDPQPEAGIASVNPQVYSADLTEIGFESAYSPSRLSESPEVEYKVGRIGGPYKRVASVPRQDVSEAEGTNGGQAEGSGWVAANGGFSKLVLQSRDHSLLGGESETGTKSGSDLYEYTAQGGLKQLNVMEREGETVMIGSCGAKMVDGEEDPESSHFVSSSHSVSNDGTHIFFEAVPGKNCSAQKNLFIRVDGEKTVDIGAYVFVATDPQGMRVLVRSDGTGELTGYNTVSEQFESQSGGELAEEQELASVGVPVRIEPEADDTFARPRYTYWREPDTALREGQDYRYDDVEHVVECISCASPFDPQPKPGAYLDGIQGLPRVDGGLPDFTAVSGNGDFAFFTTIAALVPQDVDGEIPIEANGDPGEFVDATGHASPSTDVYEWRAGGVDGCGLVGGCVALISDGQGGYLNLLLGTANEGNDVFFYTRSSLWSGDKDPEGSIGEGNIYDARVGGGFPPPPAGVKECEGDECSRPPSAPVDSTPSSFTFSGPNSSAQIPSVSVKKAKLKKKIRKKIKLKKKGKLHGSSGKRKPRSKTHGSVRSRRRGARQ